MRVSVYTFSYLINDDLLFIDPTVLIRRHCVILLLDPIRAIIMSDRLLLLVPNGADMLISILDKHMSGKIRSVVR